MLTRPVRGSSESTRRAVVVGVAEHTGWAILVSAAAVHGTPIVVDRRRVKLIEDGMPTQPYEHDSRALPHAEAEQLLRNVKRSIAVSTGLAFDRLSADLSRHCRVSAIAIRHPPLTRLPTIPEVHRSYHVSCRADGMLYHSAICEAARQRRWTPVFHRRGEEMARAAEALQASADEVEQVINDLRHSLKPPWTVEHRAAFAAAIAILGRHSRLQWTEQAGTTRGCCE